MYMEQTVWALLQEGILVHEDISASTYFRTLVVEDFKRRGLLSPEIIDSLITGQDLKIRDAA